MKFHSIWNPLLKAMIFGLVAYIIYRHIILRANFEELYLSFISSISTSKPIFLIIAILLMPLNWFLESLKWRKLMLSAGPISKLLAYKTIFSGISLGIITPQRLGEYGGRLLTIPAEKNWLSILSTLAGSISQNIVTLGLGIIGLSLLSMHTQILNNLLLFPILIAIIVFLSAGIYLFLNVDFVAAILSKLQVKKYFLKFQKQYHEFRLIPRAHLAQVLFLSLLRYMIYSSQYMLLIYFLGWNIEWNIMLAGISTIFLIQSGIPIPPFLGVLARGEIGIVIWSLFEVNELSILTLTFLIWILNLVVPALLGLIVIFNVNIIAALGYSENDKT